MISTILKTSSLSSRVVFLFLIIWILKSGSSDSMATAEENTESRSLFKDGQVIIGGFPPVFGEGCHTINTQNIGSFEGMIYAIEEINKNGDLLQNVTLGYDIRDLCSSAIVTARHAYQFAVASTMNCKTVRCLPNHKCLCDVNGNISSQNYTSAYPVIAIVGSLPSRVALPLANFFQAVQIPYVESAATSEKLSSSIYGSFFRTVPSDANQAKAIADIIDYFGWSYVATVAIDDSYGRHGVIALERESTERKTFCTKLFGYIPLYNYNSKLATIVSILQLRKSAGVVVVWGSSELAKELLTVAASVKLNRVWIFSEAFAANNPEFLSTIPNLTATGIHLGINLQSKSPERFLQHLQDKLLSNQSQERFWWKPFWEYVNLTIGVSHGSSNVANNNISTDQLLRSAYDEYAIYMIDAVYSVAHALDRMLKCKNSNVSDNKFCPDIQTSLETGQLVEYLKRVEFEGVVGKVQFDSRGDPVKALYDIVYFKISESETVTKHVIGSWNKSRTDRLRIRSETIKWKGYGKGKAPSSECADECKPGQWKVVTADCCWKCLTCIDGSVSQTRGALNCTRCTRTQMSNPDRTQCIPLLVTNIDWSDTLAVLLSVISVLGIAVDVSVFVILWYFRDTPIVRALNKVCTLVLLLGIAMCFGMTLSYIVKPSSRLCSLLKPLRYVVYTLCCSALFLKTMQIVHAFDVSQYRNWAKVFICSTKRQVIVLVTIIAIEVLFSALWILLDPPYAHVSIVPKRHVFFMCVPYRGTPGKILDSLMLVYLVLVAGCCIYYAFRARNLPANFNEAKHISFSLYVFLLSWITYYPVEFATEGWYVAVLSGATLLLSSYGLLGSIFAPKLFIIVFRPQKNTVEFIRAEMRQDNASCRSNIKCSSVSPHEAQLQ